MKNQHIYDKAYKYLLSNPYILKELLETFVHMDWVKLIDFDKTESLNTTFISDEFKKKESDIIYKLKLKDKEIYLYLLIEFQSTVDKYISVRVLRYILEFYEYLIKHKKADKLPVVFPIVLYNGNEKWTALQNISDLIDYPSELKNIKQFLPNFKYFPIIENEYSIEDLEKIKNIISTVFLIENSNTTNKILAIFNDIENRIKNENMSAVKAFFVWATNYLNSNASIEVIEKTTAKIRSIEEVKSMFATTLEKWETKLIHKGMEKGREEGIQQGREEGIQQGREDNKIMIARNLLLNGAEMNFVAKVTELNLDVVKKIKLK